MQFFYKQPVLAGVPLRLPYAGLYFILVSAGAARQVDIQLEKSGQTYNTMPGMTNGFAIETGFDAVTFSSPTDTIVSFFASSSPVRLGSQDGMQVSVPNGVQVTNDVANPVPVNILGATLTVNDVSINNTPAQAIPVTLHGSDNTTPIPIQKAPLTTLVDIAPVVVGVAAVALISDATLKRLTVRNPHATAIIALGGAGVTLANGARVLLPGDMWVEEDAAGAAWFAISDTAATSVQVSGAK